MSQLYFSAQFITETQGTYNFQPYNFEILNYTSLNFARPTKPTDSHTASMTAERRKLFDQLPRLNTNVTKGNNVPKSIMINSKSNASNDQTSNTSQSQSSDHNKKDEVTPRVKFVIDPNQHRRTRTEVEIAADIDNVDNDSKRVDDNTNNTDNTNNANNADNIDHRKKKNRVFRRASAPAQGVDYYFKNAKQSKINAFYYNSIKKNNNNNSLCVPDVHIEVDEESNHDHDQDHDHNHNQNTNSTSMSSSVTSVSSNTSCNPPPLSPCSSKSSIDSSIDMTSPGKQPSFAQAFNHITVKSRNSHLTSDIPYQSEAHSLPEIVNSPYGSAPWSPAAMYLSNFANKVQRSLPDEEGQQVGEYIIGKVIGRGGFSTVKQAYAIDYSGSMNTVAVKIVKNHIDSDDNDRIQSLLEREIAIWRRLDHPNIVRMITAEEYDEYATFVFSEYCPGGTLLDYIKKNSTCEGKGLDEDEARNIFLEIAEAIRYLHNDVRLVHKDIKLDNVLLDQDTWKICDFGLTEFQSSVNGFNDVVFNSTVGGSIAYCAPEQLRSPTPLKDPSVDIWSLGVVLFTMITGQLPFNDSFEPRLQLKIINGRYDESLLDDSNVSDELRDLLRGMFKTKPDQRLTISQILEHPWCERC